MIGKVLDYIEKEVKIKKVIKTEKRSGQLDSFCHRSWNYKSPSEKLNVFIPSIVHSNIEVDTKFDVVKRKIGLPVTILID